MNISDLSKKLIDIINDNGITDVNILFGNINKNNIMNTNIYENIYNRFKKFISSKYKMNEKILKIYYHNDIKLISTNENTHICIRMLPIQYYDFIVSNDKYHNSYSNIRLICQNYRIINNINFPSLINYNNININNITYCTIKYKNSEIILEFTENNKILSINLKTIIDKYNIHNFIKNFEFIISKFYMKRFTLSSDLKYSHNKNLIQNKCL